MISCESAKAAEYKLIPGIIYINDNVVCIADDVQRLFRIENIKTSKSIEVKYIYTRPSAFDDNDDVYYVYERCIYKNGKVSKLPSEYAITEYINGEYRQYTELPNNLIALFQRRKNYIIDTDNIRLKRFFDFKTNDD